jgi:AbrB family looped-hinge helix DNA binding protein
MQYTATISSKGQITLPAKIRRSLNIASGDRITITKIAGGVRLTPSVYDEELSKLREKITAELKSKGKWGIPYSEVRRFTDEARLVDYEKKYGTRP